jgi:hypothetical protein
MTEPQRADREGMPLRLQWRQTRPDGDADYIAETLDYPGNVGRIFRHDTGPDAGAWLWAMQADGHEISRNVGELNGVERSPKAAARMVEDAWFRAIKGSSLDRPTAKPNAYAMAKSGE